MQSQNCAFSPNLFLLNFRVMFSYMPNRSIQISFLKCWRMLASPGSLFKHRFLGPATRSFDSYTSDIEPKDLLS